MSLDRQPVGVLARAITIELRPPVGIVEFGANKRLPGVGCYMALSEAKDNRPQSRRSHKIEIWTRIGNERAEDCVASWRS